MGVYMLENAIKNEKFDLELAIGQLKKEKGNISQSFQGRKKLAV